MLWSEIHFIDKTGKLIEKGTYYNKTSMQVYEKLQNKHYYLLITEKEAQLVKDAYDEGVKRGFYISYYTKLLEPMNWQSPCPKASLLRLSSAPS